MRKDAVRPSDPPAAFVFLFCTKLSNNTGSWNLVLGDEIIETSSFLHKVTCLWYELLLWTDRSLLHE